MYILAPSMMVCFVGFPISPIPPIKPSSPCRSVVSSSLGNEVPYTCLKRGTASRRESRAFLTLLR